MRFNNPSHEEISADTGCINTVFAGQTQAGNGSFLILKRVYFYNDANTSEKRLLTKSRKAYEVTDVSLSTQKTVMFRIIVPQVKSQVNGTGYIIETEADLRKMGNHPVKVYANVLTTSSDFSQYQLVKPTDLSFSGRQENSPDFPNISWKAVNFKTSIPGTFWVPDWSGIYRPDKNAAWLNRTYEKAKQHRLKDALLHKILLGMVEIGFTKSQVGLALGEPLKTKKLDKANQEEWQYNGRTIVFELNRVLRVL